MIKKIRCPNCGKVISIDGNPGETIKVVCPNCDQNGKFTFPGLKNTQIEDKPKIAVKRNSSFGSTKVKIGLVLIFIFSISLVAAGMIFFAENSHPQLSITADPIEGYQPLDVSFIIDASDPDGEIETCVIDFGDGNTSIERSISHIYNAGTYTAVVTVTDNEGAETKKDVVILVKNYDPVVSISESKNEGIAPLSVSFTVSGQDSDGTIVSYYWNFDDGSTSDERNPTHTFNSAGSYNVTLTVTDNNGATATDTSKILVSENKAPIISASADPISGYVPLTVQFTASASDPDGSISSYHWDFDDGSTSSEQNPTHTFTSAGEYMVEITVEDDYDESVSDTLQITANKNPAEFVVSDLIIEPTHVEPGETVEISVDVENIGELSGSKNIQFNINGEVESENVTLEPEENQRVYIYVTMETEGIYDVNVAGLSQSIHVHQLDWKEVGESYEAADGLTVTLESFDVLEKTGSYQYKIEYTLSNEIDSAIDEGSFKLYGDENLPQYGSFDKLFPGDSITRSYTFEEEKHISFDILAYHHDQFFEDSPPEEALIWKVKEPMK